MDQQVQQGPTFEESIAQVMKTLPPPIRRYLGQGKYSVVANNLMTKYDLHIDQGGVLEREIMLLLMGIENPDEFTKALAGEAKLDQQTVGRIVQDINAQIFVPLREEMRKGTAQMGRNEPLRSVLNAVTARPTQPPPRPPAPSVPASSLQQPASRLLEDHEEPHIEFKKNPAPPPPNLPGAIYHPPIVPPPPPVPTQPPPPPPPAPPVPLKPKPVVPVAPYSSDPYHEPIEP